MNPALISVIIPDLRGGGAERVMIDLAREFVRAGHIVEFVLMQAAGEFLSEVQREFLVVNLATAKTRALVAPLVSYLRRRKPAAVIANMWPLTAATVIGRSLSRQRCRLLLVEHSVLSEQYKSWGFTHSRLITASMIATYRFSDHVAAVSRGAALDVAQLAFLPRARVEVLHNPIPQRPVPRQDALAAAEALWNGASGRRVLTVGSFKVAKNHPLLLRAFALMTHTDARLMFVGQGQGEAQLRALATELGIADRVIFAGFQSDPSPFYATADLFALSSDYEGLGNVVIEAMSFGVPIVSTNCPAGPFEILEGGRLGRLVPVGDVGAFAKAMDAAVAERVDREALRRRAADFAPELAARRYLNLLGLT